MLLNPATDGSVTGTGVATFQSRILGGVAITADGTNDATITLQRNNSSGFTVFKIVTKSPLLIAGPISIGTQAGFYTVTGDGAAAQFYEWTE